MSFFDPPQQASPEVYVLKGVWWVCERRVRKSVLPTWSEPFHLAVWGAPDVVPFASQGHVGRPFHLTCWEAPSFMSCLVALAELGALHCARSIGKRPLVPLGSILVFIPRLDANSLRIWAALSTNSDCTRSDHQLHSNHSVSGSYYPLYCVTNHVRFQQPTRLD